MHEMTELTDAGLEAMARELLHIASNGERNWDQETPEFREELRGYIDLMIDKARDAEERASR
jgi:hypothetical protein